MNAMTKVGAGPVVLQTMNVMVSHTETHLTVALPDEEAHHLAGRYVVERDHDNAQALKVVPFVKGQTPTLDRGRGVRPGTRRKLHGKDVRYMQFRPVPGLILFAAGESQLYIMEDGSIFVDLPNPLPAYKPHSGWSKRKGYTTNPDPDPVPFVAPALAPPPKAKPTIEISRMTIAQAVKVVNAFLADTPGAQLELVKQAEQPDRIRVSIIEVFE